MSHVARASSGVIVSSDPAPDRNLHPARGHCPIPQHGIRDQDIWTQGALRHEKRSRLIFDSMNRGLTTKLFKMWFRLVGAVSSASGPTNASITPTHSRRLDTYLSLDPYSSPYYRPQAHQFLPKVRRQARSQRRSVCISLFIFILAPLSWPEIQTDNDSSSGLGLLQGPSQLLHLQLPRPAHTLSLSLSSRAPRHLTSRQNGY